MCGRYYIEIEEEELRSIIAEVEKELAGYPSDWKLKMGEIFPTNIAPVIAEIENEIGPHGMMWGFPRWQGSGVVFNARAETAVEKNMFREALLTKRVAVPTSGFYEWKKVEGKGKKDKYIFRESEQNILYLAGFYNVYADKDGFPNRFTILTTDANEAMAPFHNRMPVLLHQNEIEEWIRGRDFQKIMERVPIQLEAQVVDGT